MGKKIAGKSWGKKLDHDSMFLVMVHLCEAGPQRSRETAEALGLRPGYVSVILSLD